MSKKSDKIKHQEENLESIESALTKSELFIEQYQKQIAYVIGGLVLLVVIVMMYNRKIVLPKEIEAESELFAGEVYFEKDSFQLAIDGDGSFIGMLSIIDEYGSTPSGNLAKYYTGISYMHLGDYEAALDYLKKFDLEGEQVAPVALGAMGDCYIELDETGKAIDAYKKAIEYKNELTTPIHMQKLGVAYEIEGKGEKAIETYEALKTAYPTSTEAREIDKYIQRAKAI